VNTLRFADDGGIHADNTDGIGLVNDIERNAAVPLQGKALLLIGAGGAAAGVLGPLLDAGASRVVVANRTVGKAVELVRRHAAVALRHGAALEAWALDEVPGSFDVVVNATASSLAGDAVPVNASVLRPGGLAVDMMYGPAAAGFMAWAEAHGATARDGLGMLVEQAAEAFEIWRGVRPPSAQVLAEIRAELAALAAAKRPAA
jgi:shikimate dehydrogenase